MKRSQEPEGRSQQGKVSLVGAGPGDPGLITVAGLERIRDADVIVYDRLANRRLLDQARPDAELIDVGKIPGDSHDQPAINRCLIDKAREGHRVVRLKGGDPFVFGRGGEEAEALRAAGIDFEVVPGVTSAVAVPAYAGIPVTHRGVAQSFAVITGHEAETTDQVNAPALTLPTADTLVFLMGVKALPETVRRVIEAGRPADTPVAVIRWGTTPDQQTVTGTLADIVELVQEAGLKPPAVTVVGEVVRLRETISWFESKPLFGKRVLITRTRKQASTLAKLLADEGAIPIELPSIEIEPCADPAAVDAAAERLAASDYAWTIFTSANAVKEWFRHLTDRNLDARAFGGGRVAAIGPATATALEERGISADLVPDEYVAESIFEAIKPHLQQGPAHAHPEVSKGERSATPRILMPRAADARSELPDGLRALGVEVDEVTLYRAAFPTDAPPDALEMLLRGEIDIVTFTSSSTVRNLATMVNRYLEDPPPSPEALLVEESTRAKVVFAGSEPVEFIQFINRSIAVSEGMDPNSLQTILGNPTVACIGPITAQTAREMGLRVDVEAAEHTVEGLAEALVLLMKEATE